MFSNKKQHVNKDGKTQLQATPRMEPMSCSQKVIKFYTYPLQLC